MVPVPHRDIKVQDKRVHNTLVTLNTHQAFGLDGIPAVLLKKCALELTPVLRKTFQNKQKSFLLSQAFFSKYRI